jgi:hypothetical protein
MPTGQHAGEKEVMTCLIQLFAEGWPVLYCGPVDARMWACASDDRKRDTNCDSPDRGYLAQEATRYSHETRIVRRRVCGL